MFDNIIKGVCSPVSPVVKKLVYKTGQTYGKLCEKNCHTVLFISDGSGSLVCNDNTVNFHTGDIFCLPASTEYEYTFDKTGSPTIYAVEYKLNYSDNNKSSANNYLYISSEKEHTSKIVKIIFDRMIEKESKDVNGKELLLLSDLYKLLYELYYAINEKNAKRGEISRGIKYIESNYLEEFEIEYVARLCGMCLSLFYKNFKESTGLTPIEYKNHLKIDRAIELLREKTYSLDEISTMLNFCNQSYFIKTFKRFTGHTPKQFISQNRVDKSFIK